MPNLDLIFGPGPHERETRMFRGDRPLGSQLDGVVLDLQIAGTLGGLPGAQMALFRRSRAGYTLLRRDQSPDELGLRSGEDLYLADELTPWMEQPASPTPAGPAPAGGPTCRVTLAEGCVVTVAAPLVNIGRAWLLQHLRAGGRDERDHRLRFVSRSCHCELLRHGAGWAVHPEREIWLDDRPVTLGAVVPLPAGRTRLLLGANGWPLTIEPSA